ncbi:MAG: hypothetical protein GY909_15445 [Oligoflexia bacterium]|nr:hypothetical protein [Oligoflexia bacterium]
MINKKTIQEKIADLKSYLSTLEDIKAQNEDNDSNALIHNGKLFYFAISKIIDNGDYKEDFLYIHPEKLNLNKDLDFDDLSEKLEDFLAQLGESLGLSEISDTWADESNYNVRFNCPEGTEGVQYLLELERELLFERELSNSYVIISDTEFSK